MKSALCVPLLALACSAPSAPRADVHAEAVRFLARGRAELAAGDAAAAETSFRRAAELEPDAFAPRLWILRAWMEQGRNNDTLDALDALDREGRKGRKGPDMSYLYGMAFVRRAQGYVAAGVNDASVQMNFQDGATYLAEVVAERPQDYPDAYQALATAAWYTQDLAGARKAAEQAVSLAPSDPAAWLVLGRVALSQFVASRDAAGETDASGAHWQRARQAFETAVTALGTPTDAAQRARVAEAAQELGQTWIWKSDHAPAARAFALAIGYAPERADYAQTLDFLSGEAPEGLRFREALEEAATIFRGYAPASDPRAGALSWWLGWARYQQRDFPAAVEAFQASLAANPEYVNAWFYVAMARFELQDWSGAAAALEAGWDAGPDAIVAAMSADAEANAARVEYLIGRIYPASIETADGPLAATSLLPCAHLAEICAESVPGEPRHWNNLGLFLRDEGDRLEASAETPPDPALLADLHERALAAYQRALALTPNDPQVLNDTAVMLHYYLDREPERALEMYTRASELAAARIAQGDLPAAERDRYETALTDATNNKQALEELLAERAGGGAK